MAVTEKTSKLPRISETALANTQEVIRLLARAIARAGGRITFARFMDIAMFAPGHGYYDSANHIFGDDGDFTTAPELSPLFGQCIAQQICQVMKETGPTNVLEFGAGSGVLAQNILMELERQNSLPEHYYIYDISPSLRQRQQARLQQNLPHLINRLSWLSDIPESFNGVIVANEVLDAMPVHKVVFHSRTPHTETWVTLDDDRLVLTDDSLSSDELAKEMDRINQLWPDIEDGYRSEINLQVKQWAAQISQMLGKGLVLLIDYGFSRREYYQPINHMGNLMCYLQHHPHDDPLLYPGIQDVTCHVDFSLVAESFQSCGLEVAGYTEQGFFLAGCGLEELYQRIEIRDDEHLVEVNRGLEQIIMPHAMGESFKVIGLTKGLDMELIGFSVVNNKDKL